MTTTNNTSTQKSLRLLVLFVLLVLSTTGAFAQTTNTTFGSITSTEVSVSNEATIVITNETAVAASMDFAIWFMGSKKTSINTTSNGSFSKKQLINSGINTNSVLIRSFLKKMSTQENGVA